MRHPDTPTPVRPHPPQAPPGRARRRRAEALQPAREPWPPRRPTAQRSGTASARSPRRPSEPTNDSSRLASERGRLRGLAQEPRSLTKEVVTRTSLDFSPGERTSSGARTRLSQSSPVCRRDRRLGADCSTASSVGPGAQGGGRKPERSRLQEGRFPAGLWAAAQPAWRFHEKVLSRAPAATGNTGRAN